MKPKKINKAAKQEQVKVDPEAKVVSYINDCHRRGKEYRDKFKPRWDTIEGQIRCAHPDAWSQKEEWQTKVFVPQQSKTSETAQSYLDKMLFGNKRFYGIQGVEQRDKQEEAAIEELFGNIFERGNFFVENDFVLNEACSGPGTSFLKVTCNPGRTGLTFSWRSVYNITVDPSCGHKLSNAQWMTDEYKRPLQKLIDDAKTAGSIYSKESIEKLLKCAQDEGASSADEALINVRSFDGTSVAIHPNYKEISIVEFWGLVETKDGGDKELSIWSENVAAVANGKVLLRNDANDYGFKPFFACRIKPRKYDFYALGFLDNTVDLQELTNSMVNLGFDSLKMCSMDIAMIDENKVKDPASIEYRPMAVWKFKGNPREAVLLTRQGISALSDIIRGMTILDQFQQEATGVLRQVQGAPELGGGSNETLGEYQAKLAMIDNRFLKIARFVERDYIEDILKGIFKITFNPKFFNQTLMNRILGMKKVTVQIPDPSTGQMMRKETMEPKLDFDKIAKAGDSGYDFSAFGMTQFSKSIETLQKLKELLMVVVKTPQLQILFDIKELVKRTLQAAEIQDYEELMKSDEEIEQIMHQVYSGVNAGSPGAAPGAPAGPAI